MSRLALNNSPKVLLFQVPLADFYIELDEIISTIFIYIRNAMEVLKMSVTLDGKRFYSISEACKLAGTNRTTLLRWVRQKKFTDVEYRDRNGWRLFTDEDISRLTSKVNQIQKTTAGG